MPNATYKELFDGSLEEQISAGGDAGTIVTMVNADENHDPTARHFAFTDWINEKSLTCTLYGKVFRLVNNEVEEDQYVLCRKCRSKNRG